MGKKKNEVTIRSSAAEYLTFVASTGDSAESFEMRYEEGRRFCSRSGSSDESVSEVFSPNFIICFIGSRGLINTVFSSGYKFFGVF